MSETARIGAFIYARADSRRLPGKVLLPFGQGTLLEHVIDRAKQVHATTWAMLTSDRAIDDGIACAARDAGLAVIRGSAMDLVERTVSAISTLQVTRFVRINADSPLFEPRLVNACLWSSAGKCLVSNLLERRFPYGVAVEVVDAAWYLRLADTAWASEREHVTRHLYRQARVGSVLSVSQNADHSHLHLAVDVLEDHARLAALCDAPDSRLASYWGLLNLEAPVLRYDHWGDGFRR